MSAEALEALERTLGGGGEPDDVLREAVSVLATEPGIEWAGIAFLDEGMLVLGPTAGNQNESRRVSVPILFHDSRVGELWIDGRAERPLLERAAALLSELVLIGWDTQGEAWEP